MERLCAWSDNTNGDRYNCDYAHEVTAQMETIISATLPVQAFKLDIFCAVTRRFKNMLNLKRLEITRNINHYKTMDFTPTQHLTYYPRVKSEYDIVLSVCESVPYTSLIYPWVLISEAETCVNLHHNNGADD